jgi:heme exporter protein D
MSKLELGGIKMKKLNVLQLIKEKKQKEDRLHQAKLAQLVSAR